MSNSRMRLMAKSAEKPTNTSKGKGLILETPYKPGFVDDKDLETVKMAVDKELSEISNAFYQTTERTADTITRVDKLEISGDGIDAKIEEVDRVSKEGDIALASRITTISAQVGKNTSSIVTESEARASADEVITKRVDTILGSMEGDLGPLVGQFQEQIRVLGETDGVLAERITELSAEYKLADEVVAASVKTEEEARVTADNSLASQISTVKSQLGDDIAQVQQTASTEINRVEGKVDSNGNAINTINAKWGVQVNVNDKITGISLNNDGKSSAFSVQADRFTFSDGANTTNPPFEIIGGHTRIMSAYVNSLQSDTWDGANNGWAITRDGYAKFNNVHVRGTVEATNGTFNGTVNANAGNFNNVVIRENCTILGDLSASNIVGAISNIHPIGNVTNQSFSVPAEKRSRTALVTRFDVSISPPSSPSAEVRMYCDININGNNRRFEGFAKATAQGGTSRVTMTCGHSVGVPAGSAANVSISIWNDNSFSTMHVQADGAYAMVI